MISQVAVRIAADLVRRRVRETSRNRGPEIDAYHLAVGLKPEDRHPWCTSGLFWIFDQAAKELGVKNPFPKTGKAVRVWQRAPEAIRRPNPAPGLVYILAHGKPGDLLKQWKNSVYTSAGHIGIVESVDENGIATEISGNTNEAGSREGNCWARHVGSPEVSHGGMLLGYLDFDAAVA